MDSQEESNRTNGMTRRNWLASALMGLGLVASYGTLATQVLNFLLPARLKPPTRRLFIGPVEHFPVDGVQSIFDLEGNEILVKRTSSGFRAFSSTCPHLGCKVKWQADKREFFCPCHNGVFDADGRAISGPPADAGQSLYPAPLVVDEESGVVYIEVPAPKRRKA